MPSHLLDVVIDETQFSTAMRGWQGPVWLVLRADGVSQFFASRQVLPQATVHFNTSARFVLNVVDLENAYFSTTLCGYENGTPVALAAARIRLSNLPSNEPGRFSFPLVRTGPGTDEIALVAAQAALSPLNLRSTYSGQSAPAMVDVPPPMRNTIMVPFSDRR